MASIKEVGQLFMVGFHGHEVDSNITTLIQEYGIGYVVLFQRNVRDAQQLRKLTDDLQRIAKEAGHSRPLFIAIDQEGGLVTRIKPPVGVQMPGAMTLGASDLPDAALKTSEATAQALAAFGVNMNLAPICDVNSEPDNPVIGVRSPSDDPNRVGAIASDIAKGLRKHGICPVAKHFPGHGDTAVDSHYGLPVIEKNMADFEACELVPFRKVVSEGIESVMTAHISIPALTDGGLPASLSDKATNLLRKELGFEGLLMSDCLEMDGVRAGFGTVKGAEMAFASGTDCIMICHTFDLQVQAIKTLAEKLQSGELPMDRFQAALKRTNELKDKYLSWDTLNAGIDLPNMSADHKKLARSVYESAVTLVGDRSKLLPLPSGAKIAFLYPGAKPVVGGAVGSGEVKTRVPTTPTSFIDAVMAQTGSVESIWYDEEFEVSNELVKHLSSLDAVLLATRNARQAKYQHQLGMLLASQVRNLIVIATCEPYDFLEDDEVPAYLTAYEPTTEAFEVAVDIVFGKLKAKGHLPVRKRNQ